VNNTKSWQVAFLIGIIFCIVVSVGVLGSSLFTVAITVSSVIVGILNALLNPTNTPQGNWFSSRIREVLNVNKFLKLATIMSWTITVGVSIYGGMNLYYESKKITITGRVLTAGGDLVNNAFVYLSIADQQREAITTGGIFRFENVLPNSEQVTLQAQWDNPTTKETLKSEQMSFHVSELTKELEIKLQPGNPPFKITYYWLEGYAIDFLLRYRQIDKKLERVLGSQPIILKNGTLKELDYLMKNFSEPASPEEILTNIPGEDTQATAENIKGKNILVGVARGEQPDYQLSESDFMSIFINEPTCNLIPVFSEQLDKTTAFPYELYFWRFATLEHFNSFFKVMYAEKAEAALRFYKYITKDFFPPDFSILYCSSSYDADSCPVSNAFLLPRYLQLRVATIENISEQPITINNFLVRENNAKKLRSSEDDQLVMKNALLQRKDFFSEKILKKGQVILIPLEINLTYDESGESVTFFDVVEYFSNSKEREKAIDKLISNSKLSTDPREKAPFKLDEETLLRLLNKSPESPLLEKDYVFGPSMEIVSLNIGNVDYPVREYDEKLISFMGGYAQGGSCPYVYTYSSEKEAWHKEGQILGGLNSRLKEAVYKKLLSNFDGRLLIREEEPEVSYIDWLSIRVTTDGGDVINLHPQNHRLRYKDRSYQILRQGEEILIKFDLPKHIRAVGYAVLAKGYYVRVAPK
jgi:hypothetical protein